MPPLVARSDLEPIFDRREILSAVRSGLIAHAKGEVTSPLPGCLLFDSPPGDTHIKFAQGETSPFYVVKISSGFYENPARGLPVNSGMLTLFDKETGAPAVIFLDDGLLTGWRTAAAGTLAAGLATEDQLDSVGMVGAGYQAELQAHWLLDTYRPKCMTFWSRRQDQAQALAQRMRVVFPATTMVVASSIEELARKSSTLITTTCASKPLIDASMIRDGSLIIGVGADAPGKNEISPSIFSTAENVVVDDYGQCLDHGDLGNAMRANGSLRRPAITLGAALEHGVPFPGTTIVDLTGVAAQDLAIAQWAWRKLNMDVPTSDEAATLE